MSLTPTIINITSQDIFPGVEYLKTEDFRRDLLVKQKRIRVFSLLDKGLSILRVIKRCKSFKFISHAYYKQDPFSWGECTNIVPELSITRYLPNLRSLELFYTVPLPILISKYVFSKLPKLSRLLVQPGLKHDPGVGLALPYMLNRMKLLVGLSPQLKELFIDLYIHKPEHLHDLEHNQTKKENRKIGANFTSC